jgi:hypothetical protein
MSKTANEILSEYRDSIQTTNERRLAAVSLLGELSGSRVSISGFPSSTVMKTRMKKPDAEGNWFRKFTVPSSRRAALDKAIEPEVRTVADGTIVAVDDKSVRVMFNKDPEYEHPDMEATGFVFRIERIVDLELMPEKTL